MRSFLLLPPLLLASLAAQSPAALSAPAGAEAGSESIDPEQIRGWLTKLASREFAGRGTGSEGFQKAAEFMRDHFAQLGLNGAGDQGTYWQRVPWGQRKVDAQKTRFVVEAAGKKLFERGATSGLGGSAGSEVDASGPITLLRLGAGSEPSFEPLPAGGDLLLVCADQGFPPRWMTQFARALRELPEGSRPAAVLYADDDLLAEQPQLGGSSGAGRRANPAAAGRGLQRNLWLVSRATVDAMLKEAGQAADALAPGKPLRLPGLTAKLTVALAESTAPAFNVIGVLPGADKDLAGEYVVIGSHLDHLGERGQNWFPGADDDGSGSAGVMAIAQAFVKNGARPRRSILFVTFCGEESGLVGSRWFVNHPPIPLGSIVAELQVDMIGRNEEDQAENRTGETAEQNRNTLHLIGSKKLSNDLHELCIATNQQHARFELEWDEEDVYTRSDHYCFAEKGVPIAFFFTGFHRDYHRPTDTPDKIDYDKLARVARYVFQIAWQLANQDGRPQIEPELWSRPAPPAAPIRGRGSDR
jgi:hypothetical protein